ncbi:prepilin-type N-terminal cleavage/methylation domain-containing protein [Candidatus Sumerlaeota bacterium]|nr:prepilin-type N-terminal cleavage/methylation domain-containing protein [Candidatus Sumerlaeota bacterium]
MITYKKIVRNNAAVEKDSFSEKKRIFDLKIRRRGRLKFISHGFTLIELLIVVAIIAILAAIAVPNFLEAQIRSKASRAKNDLRALENAIECYILDNNNYPYVQHAVGPGIEWQAPFGFPPGDNNYAGGLTTPVAYISGILWDPFELESEEGGGLGPSGKSHLYYERIGWGFDQHGNRWNQYGSGVRAMRVPVDGKGVLTGTAPDFLSTNPADVAVRYLVFSVGPNKSHRVFFPDGSILVRSRLSILNRYDPTNGTISPGCIVRYSGIGYL